MNYVLTSILIMFGSLFFLVTAIGLIRFNDLYGRLHATTKTTSFGILLLLAGVVAYFYTWNVLLKAILIVVFIYLTAPLAAHAIIKSFRDSHKR